MALDNNMIQEEPGKLLRDYQSGSFELSEDEKPKVGKVISQPSTPSYRDILRANPLSNTIARDYTEEAKEAGFGLSKYDSDFYPELDIEQSRAIEQSGFSKIGTGLMKGGVTAATTALNTTLGTVFGLGSSLYELAADADGDGRSFMDTIDAGVNNWLSNQLVKIQNWAEDVFPNYRTAEERSERYQREWWKHMGTANFIGDSILKNFGFTVGAMVGGIAWSKLIGAGLSKQLANNIMKGAVAAAEGDSEAASLMRAAAEAVKKGTATEAQQALARAGEAVARGTAVGIDAEALVSNIENAAKALNKFGAKLQLYGAAVGAMGEGTVEGIMAKNEFLEEYNRNWEDQYEREYGNLENDILESGNLDWVNVQSFETPDGIRKTRSLTDAGRDELYKRQQKVTADYQAAKEFAEEQADRLSSTTFLLNLPILTTSNAIQFGRMLSGGWKTSRGVSKGVRGGLKRTAQGLTGGYDATGNVATRTAFGALKVAGSESFEEMAQGTVSSGAKEVASRNLATFNNDGYDPDAINSVREWFAGMYTGGKDYLNDPKNWQEGAIGALTGLFGIPGRRWSGGVVEAYRDAKDKTESARTAAQTLNNTVNSKEFQNRWRGYIRHLKYDNDMDKAIANDDEYSWHTADDKQLINDVIMFADAGKLGDLEQIVSHFGSLSASEAKGIKDAVESGKEGFEDYAWTKNLSPEDIVNKVKEQAGRIQETINQYRNFYQNMIARAPEGASDEFIKEMVFTAQQIKSYENRFLKLFGETMTAIEPIIEVQSLFNNDGKVIETKEEREARYKQIEQSYERLFSMMGLPMNVPKALRDETNKVLDFMKNYAEGDKELVKKINDMQKLANSRSVFYQKLITLQGESGQQQHSEQAATQQQMDDASIAQMAEVETEGLNTFDDVKNAYLAKNAKEQSEFLNTLSSVEEKNPAVKKFLSLKRRFDGFREFTNKNGFDVENPGVTPRMLMSMMNDLVRLSKSEEDLLNLPDSAFMSLDTFRLQFNGITPVPDGVYTDAKNAVRNAMKKYVEAENLTASRNNISSNPVTPSRENDEKPTGQDASQASSVTPAPSTLPSWMTEGNEGEKKEQGPIDAPEEPVTEAEKSGVTPMDEPKSGEELSEDAQEAEKESLPFSENLEEQEGEEEKISYLRGSMPEISTDQVTKVRKGELARKDADFSNFLDYIKNTPAEKLSEADRRLKEDPDFEKIWNALYDAHAFEATDTLLNVGDEIEFIIDPDFPTYNGERQILMRTAKNGQNLLLNILSLKSSRYYGLGKLREKIFAEYDASQEKQDNKVFVFSKKTKVWAKPAGQIDYDYVTKPEDFTKKDNSIRNIPGYRDDAPIVFIDRSATPVVIRGNANAINHLSPGAFSDSFLRKRKGRLFYLANNGDDAYVPVRLYVEHFKTDRGEDNPLFIKAREILSGIATQTKNANKVSTNWEDENKKLHEKMADLMKILDVHDLYVQLGNFNNIGPALMVVTWDRDENGARTNKKVEFRTPDQINDSWLIDKVLEMEPSFQVNEDMDIDDFINNDIITSNARMLRPKGVDFYAYPWDDSTQTFHPMTSAQKQIDEEVEAKKVAETQGNPHESTPVVEEEDNDWENAKPSNQPVRTDKKDATKAEMPAPATQLIQRTWDSLTEEERQKLTDDEWTEEEFNNSSPAEQQAALTCPGNK